LSHCGLKSGKFDDNIVLDMANHVMELIRFNRDVLQGIMLAQDEFPDGFVVPGLMVVMHHTQYRIQFVGGIDNVIFVIVIIQMRQILNGALNLSNGIIRIQWAGLSHVHLSDCQF
jgi:hypothetical protein